MKIKNICLSVKAFIYFLLLLKVSSFSFKTPKNQLLWFINEKRKLVNTFAVLNFCFWIMRFILLFPSYFSKHIKLYINFSISINRDVFLSFSLFILNSNKSENGFFLFFYLCFIYNKILIRIKERQKKLILGTSDILMSIVKMSILKIEVRGMSNRYSIIFRASFDF